LKSSGEGKEDSRSLSDVIYRSFFFKFIVTLAILTKQT